MMIWVLRGGGSFNILMEGIETVEEVEEGRVVDKEDKEEDDGAKEIIRIVRSRINFIVKNWYLVVNYIFGV